MGKLTDKMPPMIKTIEVDRYLENMPSYDEAIRLENEMERLTSLNTLFEVHYPLNMGKEIYSKLYLAILRSLQKKESEMAIKQRNINGRCIERRDNHTYGVIGGSDTFTIVGSPGIGKTSAILRALELISKDNVIEVDEPMYVKIIPYIFVQCPFDCSVKSMLLQILKEIDKSIGSDYYALSYNPKSTVDLLISSVAQACLNHVGLLIVDEIQNVVKHKSGQMLVAMLTQLINSCGISICFVGTPECLEFFESVDYLARRSLGLRYGGLDYGDEFIGVCESLLTYQYVKEPIEPNEGLFLWLYEHTGGIISNVVVLLHSAQEMAILSGADKLDLEILNRAYLERLQMLHSYINVESTTKKKITSISNNNRPKTSKTNVIANSDDTIVAIAEHAKVNSLDAVQELRKIVSIIEL